MLTNLSSSFEEPPDRTTILQQLDQEYEGISSFNLPLAKFPNEKLRKLVTYIRYSFPRFLYEQDIDQFQTELMEFYFQCQLSRQLQSDFCPLDQNKQNQSENTQNSNKGENPMETTIDTLQKNDFNFDFKCSHETAEKEGKEVTEFTEHKNVVEIRNLIKKLSENNNLVNHVSEDVKESVRFINGLKREQIKCQERSYENKNKHEYFKKSSENKNNYKNYGKNVKDEAKKSEIVIVLADKVPLQTTIMRNQIKKLAETSFAVTSEINESHMSDLQKEKINIVLLLNKLADENIDELYLEIKPLILNQTLATFFLEQMFLKGKLEQQTIPVIVKLCEKIEKIKNSSFGNQWKIEKTKKKLNPFHQLLVHQLQTQFESYFTETHRLINHKKDFLGVCKMLATFIKVGVFSKYILKVSLKFMLQHLFLEIKKQNYNQKIVEDIVEGIIVIIQTMGEKFDEKIQKLKYNSKKDEGKIIFHVFMANRKIQEIPLDKLIEVLVEVEMNFIKKTQRVNCLLKNLIERRQKSEKEACCQKLLKIKAEDHLQVQIKAIFTETCPIKKKANQEQLKELIATEGLTKVMEQIFRIIADAPKLTISDNIIFLCQTLESEEFDQKDFKEAFENVYDQIVQEECEFPYLISALAILIVLLKMQQEDFIIKKNDGDDDYEEYEYVAAKLTKKLQYYSEASNYQLIH